MSNLFIKTIDGSKPKTKIIRGFIIMIGQIKNSEIAKNISYLISDIKDLEKENLDLHIHIFLLEEEIKELKEADNKNNNEV